MASNLDIRDAFRIQDVMEAISDELARRAGGEEPDARFDPILDSALDLADELELPRG